MNDSTAGVESGPVEEDVSAPAAGQESPKPASARLSRLRMWAPILAVAAGAGLLVGSLSALAGRSSIATVGPNVVVNVPEGRDASNSPTLLRSPVRKPSLVVVNRVDRPPYSARLHHSSDDGRTWKSAQLPLPDGLSQPFAPDAAFAPDGTLYVAYVDLEPGSNSPRHLWVSRSDDAGATLGAPVEVAGPLAFQARLAVDAEGSVLVTWLQAAGVGVRSLDSNGPNPVVMARSSDGGRTFSAPVVVSDPHRRRVGAASPAVAPDGDVVVLYQDFKNNRRDFENLDGPPWDEPSALVVSRSTDQGRTFAPGVEVDSEVVLTRRFLVFLPDFPSLAVSADGSLYVGWADGRNGDDDVFLRRSADAGQTWSRPNRVNDNPVADGTAQYLPRVSVAADGRVDVVFMDGRNDRRGVFTDVYLASSVDKGRTFRNLRVTSTFIDATLGPKVFRGGLTDFGTRLGVASEPGGVSLAWTDSRLADPVTQRQDIVFATVTIVRSPARAWAWGAAATVITLILLSTGRALVAGRRKRRPVKKGHEESVDAIGQEEYSGSTSKPVEGDGGGSHGVEPGVGPAEQEESS